MNCFACDSRARMMDFMVALTPQAATARKIEILAHAHTNQTYLLPKDTKK